MDFAATFRNNRVRIITLIVLAVMFFTAIQGMDTKDWVITVIRGLAAGAIVFLVASGLSLIFGLMDVLNLAHGELFMLGAFIGWKGVLVTIFIGSAIGTLAGMTAMLAEKKDMKMRIPFGPFLAIGAVISIFFGGELIGWYWNSLV